MAIIGMYSKGSVGYGNLERLAKELTRCSGMGYRYFVGNGYLDINRGIGYTTVMCTIGKRTIHCLGPELYELTIMAIKESIIEILADMYFDYDNCIDFRRKEFLF